MSTSSDTRAANRAAMPRVTAWVDALREVFPGARVLYAREGGLELGTPAPDGASVLVELRGDQ